MASPQWPFSQTSMLDLLEYRPAMMSKMPPSVEITENTPLLAAIKLVRASLEQFKEHIQINDVLCDWIENAPVDHVISKIDTKVINKKIIIIIAFCILIFICLSILSLEIRNWIIDTAFENLKVISN